MNSRTIGRGAVIGAVAGMMMAMWSMVALAATGDGFWTPVNAIAHTVWDGAPLGGGFDGAALAVGLMVHMAVSMMLGVVIAVVASASTSVGVRSAVAIGVSMAAWAGQLVVWDAVDSAAADAFTPWVLLAGHAVFGMVAAVGLYVAGRVDTAPAQGATRATAPVR